MNDRIKAVEWRIKMLEKCGIQRDLTLKIKQLRRYVAYLKAGGY